MGLDVSALTKTAQPAYGEYMGFGFNVDYRLGIMTGPWLQEMTEADREGAVETLYTKAIELFEDWDLEYEGKKIPIKEEEIRSKVPLPLLGAVFQTAQQASTGQDRDGKNGSSATSPRQR